MRDGQSALRVLLIVAAVIVAAIVAFTGHLGSWDAVKGFASAFGLFCLSELL